MGSTEKLKEIEREINKYGLYKYKYKYKYDMIYIVCKAGNVFTLSDCSHVVVSGGWAHHPSFPPFQPFLTFPLRFPRNSFLFSIYLPSIFFFFFFSNFSYFSFFFFGPKLFTYYQPIHSHSLNNSNSNNNNK